MLIEDRRIDYKTNRPNSAHRGLTPSSSPTTGQSPTDPNMHRPWTTNWAFSGPRSRIDQTGNMGTLPISDDSPDPVAAALAGDMSSYAEAVAILRSRTTSDGRSTSLTPTLFSEPVARLIEQRAQADEAIADVLDSWIRAVPANWPADRLDDGLRFVAETRWPIVWVPRLQVVTQLLDAPEPDRISTLVANGADVLADCEAAIDDITVERYEDVLPFAHSAIAAFRDGHAAPAQALVAALLTTIVQHHLGFARLSDAKTSLTVDPDNADFDVMRIALIAGCVPDTLASFRESQGDEVPREFNRHASLHRVCVEQYTEENALIGLMLASALLRELNELEARGQWAPLQ